MNTKIRYGIYAVLILALLASPAFGWSISASFWSGANGGYPAYYYPSYYYPADYYVPTTYVNSYPDIVYPVTQQYTTNVINVQQPQTTVTTTRIIYSSSSSSSSSTSATPSSSTSTNNCGDGWCETTETPASCPQDCRIAPPTTTAVAAPAAPAKYCGDRSCNNGETKYSCPQDCGLPAYCGDGSCNGAETKYNCPQDCGLAPYCGDGKCDKTETKYNCPQDCGLPAYCGDGSCNSLETKYNCPLDCGYPQCASPTGNENDETCQGRELLTCKSGSWDFKKSVECCSNSDCQAGYKCDNHYCELKQQVQPTCLQCAVPTPVQPACVQCSTPVQPTCLQCQQIIQPVPTPQSQPVYTCGDGVCSSGETCASCPSDCGQCYRCGDGVCNTRTETPSNCPQDCGTPQKHLVTLRAPDECQEIEQGTSKDFTMVIANGGNTAEQLAITASGQAAQWASQLTSIIVPAGETRDWTVTVNVPQSAQPGLYNLTISAGNTQATSVALLHVDVRLPSGSLIGVTPVGGNITNNTAGNSTRSLTPSGAAVGKIAIPDWLIAFTLLVVIAVLLIFLLRKTSARVQVTRTVLTTDGGSELTTRGGSELTARGGSRTLESSVSSTLPVWATKARTRGYSNRY